MHNDSRTYRRPPNLFWPIVLIGVGAVWLLSNMGLLTVDPLFVLVRFWPVLLIVAGIDILFGRSLWGTIASGIMGVIVVAGVVALLFYAQGNPAWVNSLGVPGIIVNQEDLRVQHLADSLGGAKQADVTVSFPGGKHTIAALGDSANLLEGDVSFFGDLKHEVLKENDRARVNLSSTWIRIGLSFTDDREQWDLKLNPTAEYSLNLNTGSGTHAFDLSRLEVSTLNLDAGSGLVDVSLPTQLPSRVNINGGSGNVNVRLPDGVPARVEYHKGSGSVGVSNLSRVSGDDKNGVYQSGGLLTPGSYIDIRVNVGSGSVSIR